MVLKIDIRETLDKGKNDLIDPKVKVRFGFLTRAGERLNDGQIDLKLREQAQADAPGTSLSDLIKRMVKEVAYSQSRLSLREFIDRFKKNRLDDLISAKFANSLFAIDNDPLLGNFDEENEQSKLKMPAAEMKVLTHIVEFLEKYNLTSAETLYEFLKQQKADWPMVEIGQLFLEEYTEIGLDGEERKQTLRQKVSGKIRDNIDRIAAEAFQEKFNEDKKGFVMSFMMGRVIKYDSNQKKMIFDGKEFGNLMDYLDSIGQTVNRINGETLYDWLYYDSRQMATYVEEQRFNAVKFGVREAVVKTGVLEQTENDEMNEKLFFDENFDVKIFHDRYIKPAIFKFYSKKLRKLTNVREPDFLHKLNNPDNLGIRNHTVQLMRYIDALVTTSKLNPKGFLAKIRELFGLNDTPMMKSLSGREIEEYFAYCFERAEDKFRRTVSDALAYREESEVKKAFVYPDEILVCRDFSKLLEWFNAPQTFKSEFPKYEHWPDDQITFACSAFVRDFLRVSKRLSDRNFKEATNRRDLIEKYMKKTLNIKSQESVDINFKLLEEVDEYGLPVKSQSYEIVYDSLEIKDFVNGVDRELQKEAFSTDQDTITYRGKIYKVYPTEMKRFKKVVMKIPSMSLKDADSKDHARFFSKKKLHEVQALIYTGDDHYIHVKDDIARLSSEDRGKEISDENRWMLVFADNKDVDIFREYIYSTHARNLIKADDPSEGRFLTVKGKVPTRSNNSSKFKKTQQVSISKVFSFPHRAEDGSLQMIDTMLETQCQSLQDLLVYNLSDFSSTSHRSYRSERAWPLLFSLYFPPEYFGDWFKKIQNEGFTGKRGH